MHLVVPENLSRSFCRPIARTQPDRAALAAPGDPDQLNLGMLFPPQSNMLEVEVQTAARVAKLVFDADLIRVDHSADMEAFIR